MEQEQELQQAEEINIDKPVGRPSMNVDRESLLALQKKGYVAKEMAQHFRCSTSLICSKLQCYGLQQRKKYSTISDEDLKMAVSRIHRDFPAAGEKLMSGYLLAEGITVQRSRTRIALNSVTDSNTKSMRIKRREYKVPSPNSLWHMDGHMKLIRWGITTHGCIDGYSRLIVFLKSSANNRASTVFQLFVGATLQYGFPASVRSDHGGENRHVALFVNLVTDSQRHITGRSVHNQRIERLWRDVHTQVTGTFYQMFYKLEDEGKLDINNETEITALHVVYMPEINKRLSGFQAGWNRHSIRTEGNKSPEHLWMAGTLENSHKDTSAIRGILSPEGSLRQQLERGLERYGLDYDNFNVGPEVEIVDDHVREQHRFNDILARDITLEDKFLEVKSFLLNN